MSVPSGTQRKNWTTRALLAWMQDAFKSRGLDSPRLCAEILMAHVIGCDRLKLYTDPDRPASPLERETLRDLVKRALNHEPVQYLTGEAWFFGMRFDVDRRVLIPRPSTETIVEHVLQHQRAEPGFGHGEASGEGLLIADLCTGSGCVGIALAKRLQGARVAATDVSSDALEVARANAHAHAVDERMDFVQGDLLVALDQHPGARVNHSLHYLVSNPPYIPDGEWADVEPNVKDHEPELALRGGADGLDLVRPLVELAHERLVPHGVLAIELAASHADQAVALATQTGKYDEIRMLQDLEGHDRVLWAERSAD
ncbi:MAG: peptide chain release factor N(5)-glutamine methyltransferase [Planctomycetota bacterium]